MFPKMVRAPYRLWREFRNTARRGKDVWRLLPADQKKVLGLAVIVIAIWSGSNSAIALALGSVVDVVKTAKDGGMGRPQLIRLAALYLGVIGLAYLIREAMSVLRRYMVNSTCTRIDKDMSVRLVSHLMEVDLATHAHEQVGAIHGRIQRSVEGYVRFLRLTMIDFLPQILAGSIAILITMWKEPRVALAMVSVVPISVGLTIWQLVTQNGVRLDLLRIREAMDGTVVEQLGGIDYVRAANTHRQEIARVEKAAERRRAKELRHHFEMSLFGSGKALNEGFFYLAIIAFCIYLYIDGKIGIGDLMAFPMLFMSVMGPLNEVHRFVDEGHECSLKVADLVQLLDEPVDRSFRPAETAEPRLDGSVPLFMADGLCVDYRAADGRRKRALDGVSLTIHHGETIGVAGRSGCGKSTWLKVMMRLTHPTSGTVLLGGVPLDSVSRESIGHMIGYVGQNPFVFSGTIAENIAYGTEGATLDQIRRAAEQACIHEEIEAMPGGYDAMLAERGQNLSGGQRQRISLARIFLKNPPVLILDEGTSALDNISERKVQRAIHAARADRTVILVAHRLSTLLDTDKIFVFDDGRVAETGTYHELVHRGGVFADLVHSASAEAAPAHPAPALPSHADAMADMSHLFDVRPVIDGVEVV
ncbi:ABC transporter ATP-binding protein [Tundrisphaera sp. TA3]|uniref:ABC transporter ATP-binding protein n=1 Tax=Tundrisphaera sp. TA3 TaxID=3435775 RepID=UPI003EB6CF52